MPTHGTYYFRGDGRTEGRTEGRNAEYYVPPIFFEIEDNMSCVIRKPAFCTCGNKSAETGQLICTFVSACAKSRFSYDTAHIMFYVLLKKNL